MQATLLSKHSLTLTGLSLTQVRALQLYFFELSSCNFSRVTQIAIASFSLKQANNQPTKQLRPEKENKKDKEHSHIFTHLISLGRNMNPLILCTLLSVAAVASVSGEGFLITVNTGGSGWSSKGTMGATLIFKDGTKHSALLIGPAGKKTEEYGARNFYVSALKDVKGNIEDLTAVTIEWKGKHGLLSNKEAAPVQVTTVSASHSFGSDGKTRRSDLSLDFCGPSNLNEIKDGQSVQFGDICGRSKCVNGVCKDL